MAADPRDIVAVLKAELRFLESGGYHRAPQNSWKAPSMFLDSPICPNFGKLDRPHACTDCLLIDFVPPHFLDENIPCYFIPLNKEQETVNSLERQAHLSEMEEVVRQWLVTTIARLEEEASTSSSAPRCHFARPASC